MNKKLFIIILLFIILVGCEGGSYSVLQGEVDAKDYGIMGNYEEFDGEYYKVVDIEDTKKLTLDVDVYTEKGKIGVQVISPDEKVIFEKSNIKDSLKENIEINKDGKYKIMVLATKHSGSFNVYWNLKKE
ncbi:MAG: hypothetical protein ACQEQE_10390 [Bacillota bacterium]